MAAEGFIKPRRICETGLTSLTISHHDVGGKEVRLLRMLKGGVIRGRKKRESTKTLIRLILRERHGGLLRPPPTKCSSLKRKGNISRKRRGRSVRALYTNSGGTSMPS